MTNKEILKKQIIYRSTHRGTKEMDLLLGKFVKKNIDKLDTAELEDLGTLQCRRHRLRLPDPDCAHRRDAGSAPTATTGSRSGPASEGRELVRPGGRE